MKAARGQRTLDFADESVEQQVLQLPPYHRPQIIKPQEGVSSREGFRLANALRVQGYTETQIDPRFEEWIEEERGWLRWFLTRIVRKEISPLEDRIHSNAEMFQDAMRRVCNGKHGLTPMETGLWLYEMNPEALTDPTLNRRRRSGVRKSDVICVNKTHALLGSFRRHITTTYENLSKNSDFRS